MKTVTCTDPVRATVVEPTPNEKPPLPPFPNSAGPETPHRACLCEDLSDLDVPTDLQLPGVSLAVCRSTVFRSRRSHLMMIVPPGPHPPQLPANYPTNTPRRMTLNPPESIEPNRSLSTASDASPTAPPRDPTADSRHDPRARRVPHPQAPRRTDLPGIAERDLRRNSDYGRLSSPSICTCGVG